MDEQQVKNSTIRVIDHPTREQSEMDPGTYVNNVILTFVLIVVIIILLVTFFCVNRYRRSRVRPDSEMQALATNNTQTVISSAAPADQNTPHSSQNGSQVGGSPQGTRYRPSARITQSEPSTSGNNTVTTTVEVTATCENDSD